MSLPRGSSGDGYGGGVAVAPQPYFCHQCNCTVTLTPSPSADLLCPDCNGGFLEELENPNPRRVLTPFSFPSYGTSVGGGSGDFPLIFSTSSSVDGGAGAGAVMNDLSAFFSGGPNRSSPSPFQFLDGFNPLLFLQNYLQNANVQLVIQSGEGFQPASNLNLGDYFFGPGFEHLIQQLAENDPNRFGTPPASKSAVEALPDVKVSKEMLNSDSSQCAVCTDTFELGAEVKQMPCKHVYHPDCILPWLELHNSCPVCRFELPTDDPDYEQRASGSVANSNQRQNQTAGQLPARSEAVPGENPQPQTPQFAERRFRRISLPWPFRTIGSSAGTSNSGRRQENNDESNPNRENQNMGSEPGYEDLD